MPYCSCEVKARKKKIGLNGIRTPDLSFVLLNFTDDYMLEFSVFKTIPQK